MSQHCLTRGLELQLCCTLADVAVALHKVTCSNPYFTNKGVVVLLTGGVRLRLLALRSAAAYLGK